MSELFSIKQEPELEIFSDNECNPQYGPSNDGVFNDDKNSLHFNENVDIDQPYFIKTGATENNNKWSLCDNWKARSFQCYMCTKSYTTKQMLKLHINSIHMLLRPFTCKICQRSFSDKYTLTTHTRIHSGERPYTCPVCSKTFVQHSALTKHKRTHTKEKPYQCEVCLKAFSDRSSLIPHRKIHTGELILNRTFKCKVCNAGFVKNSHLVRHYKSKSHLSEVMKINNDLSSIKSEIKTE